MTQSRMQVSRECCALSKSQNKIEFRSCFRVLNIGTTGYPNVSLENNQKQKKNKQTTHTTQKNKFSKINWTERAGKNSGGFNPHQIKVTANTKRNTEIDINGDDIHKL